MSKFFKKAGKAIGDSGRITKYKSRLLLLKRDIDNAKERFGKTVFQSLNDSTFEPGIVHQHYLVSLAEVDGLKLRIKETEAKIEALDFGKEVAKSDDEGPSGITPNSAGSAAGIEGQFEETSLSSEVR